MLMFFLNERFIKQGMKLVDMVMSNNTLRNVVYFDYTNQKFKMSQDVTKMSRDTLKDNNISLSLDNDNNSILDDKEKDLKDLKKKIIDYTNNKLGTKYRYQTKITKRTYQCENKRGLWL